MRQFDLRPMMRQQAQPEQVAPWYKVVNKASDKKIPAKVYIYDAIGGWFGVDVQEFIKELNDIDKDEIHVHINSPGGSVYDGISIYNTLKQHDSTIHTYVDGLAASAASFIAQAGEKVVMARNATMMIHDAIGMCYGNRQDMLDTADLLDRVSDNVADIYAHNAGGTSEEWRALMKEETWYSAKEAVDAGLCTEMLDADSEDDDASTDNKWDLTIFNYAGREYAPSPLKVAEKIKNQLKEASVGKPVVKNETEEVEPEAPEVDEEELDDTEVEEEEDEETDEVPDEPVATASFSVLINGVATSNKKKIQNHINTLETFRMETIDQSRRDFVQGLASRNVIAATQIEKLTNFALKLDSEQYDEWKSSYDDAPSMGLFGIHGITPGDSGRPDNGVTGSVADEIETLEAIVADHRRSGMTQDKIETKASYKRLQELKSMQSQSA